MRRNIVLAFLLSLAAHMAYGQVKVMTYNVRHCAGMDLKVDYDRTAAVIAKQQPDVVALQELDSMTGRSGQRYQLGELASRTHYYPIFGSAIDYDGGKYGVGILTREQPLSTNHIPLPGEEPRVLLVVELNDYVLACTHLDLEESERLASVPIIIKEARRWQKPFILAGDWNDTFGSLLMQEMTRYFTILSGNAPNFPADKPQECIDYIASFKTHPGSELESRVINEPVASDHQPLVSVFDINTTASIRFIPKEEYRCGAQDTDNYLHLLEGKSVGVVANQTSLIGETHLVDSLVSLDVNVKRIFTPEHGFRGAADAGAKVNGGKDEKTGIEIASLYGKIKKPTPEMLQDIDIMLFDLQDVGVRFYTYISTLSYVMEACAEQDIRVVVLDCPNPNGFYIDGPVLKAENKSFVGMHPVPVVYGMTIGEYGKMVNGEGWLNDGVHCELTVVGIPGYERNVIYELPVKPSPNLPNWESVYLYPSLCFFEGTIVSVGRGTDKPFQIFGHPEMRGDYSFIPESKAGASKPLLEGQRCRGMDLTEYALDYAINPAQLRLDWLIDAYHQLNGKAFFTNYFRLLSGDNQLQRDIENGKSIDEIRASWVSDLEAFKSIREKYLIY